MFEIIKNIDIKDSKSWENRIFLTLDLDWCSDEVLEYTLDLLEEFKIKATFFVTHNTKLLEKMQKNYELGIHPNFNFLLNGDFRYGKNIEEVVKYYLDIIPNAISVRSHSITQSSRILDVFEKNGLVFDCNTFIPYISGINLKVYKHWSGMIKVPYFWEDHIDSIYGWKWSIKRFLKYKGLKVFNFHPIHIFLNMENVKRYNSARSYFKDYKKLKEFVNTKTYGTRNFLVDLIEKIKKEQK